MSAIQHIQNTAENAIQELETEITELETKIEAHKLSIQNYKVQIQALERFLNPEQSIETKTTRSRKNGKTSTGIAEERQSIVQ